MKENQKYVKEELEELINVEKLSYREIGRRYGVSDAYIKKISNKLGIYLRKRKSLPPNWVPHNKGRNKQGEPIQKEKKCVHCGDNFFSTNQNTKYCTLQCNADCRKQKRYEEYLNNQEKYLGIKSMKFIKQHILKEQNNCCAICGIKNVWNEKSIIFVLDHINGDASNNMRNNLRLVCPNCDSQLDTYKSKNKNSARKERYLLNYKNEY
jgi:hypothetical protein